MPNVNEFGTSRSVAALADVRRATARARTQRTRSARPARAPDGSGANASPRSALRRAHVPSGVPVPRRPYAAGFVIADQINGNVELV
jgi:hypothetical protein